MKENVVNVMKEVVAAARDQEVDFDKSLITINLRDLETMVNTVDTLREKRIELRTALADRVSEVAELKLRDRATQRVFDANGFEIFYCSEEDINRFSERYRDEWVPGWYWRVYPQPSNNFEELGPIGPFGCYAEAVDSIRRMLRESYVETDPHDIALKSALARASETMPMPAYVKATQLIREIRKAVAEDNISEIECIWYLLIGQKERSE